MTGAAAGPKAEPEAAVAALYAHMQAGRMAQASEGARRLLAASPDHPEALHVLGLIAHQQGRPEEAIGLLAQAVERQPRAPTFQWNLAIALRDAGRAAEAAAAFRRTLELDPTRPQGWFEYGNALTLLGTPEATAGAVDAYRRVLALAPTHAVAHGNLGECLRRLDQRNDALTHCTQAAALAPDDAAMHYNLGLLLHELGRWNDAEASLRRALEIDPQHAHARFELAELLLRRGDFAGGWEAYEWRFRMPHTSHQAPALPGPVWAGKPVAGQTVVLYGEQGFGDTIQFSRYIPLVAALGAEVVFGCSPELRPLFEGFPGISRLISRWDEAPVGTPHSPLMSLPRLFGTRLTTIPAPVPMTIPPGRRARWQTLWRRCGLPEPRHMQTDRQEPRSGATANGGGGEGGGGGGGGGERGNESNSTGPGPLTIGIIWAGRPSHGDDRYRSAPPALLAPLAEVPGVTLVSLQKGDAAAALLDLPDHLPIADLGPYLRDFADTAAALERLDLLITVDTAAAHLAGALGRPAWLLLAQFCDWRWLDGRTDSPWYPSLRLFRQPRPGDWSAVIAAVRAALRVGGGAWAKKALEGSYDRSRGASAPRKAP